MPRRELARISVKHNATTSCGTPSCANGSESASKCNAQGVCAAPTEKLCAPYTCGAKACKTACASDADCSGGNECKTDGTCAPKPGVGSSCRDEHTAVDSKGNATTCDPFKCVGDACGKVCVTVDGCVAGYICDATKACVRAKAATESDGGGCTCRLGADRSSRGGVLGLMLVALVGARRRRQRRTPSCAATSSEDLPIRRASPPR